MDTAGASLGIDGRLDASRVMQVLRREAAALGFSQIGVASVDLSDAEPGLLAWLDKGFHGEMAYMARHGLRRARPAELVPGTLSVVTVRMDYLPRRAAGGAVRGAEAEAVAAPPADVQPSANANANANANARAIAGAAAPADDDAWQAIEWARLADSSQAVVSVYARGRDYHKTLRQRMQTLADRLQASIGPFGHRVFTDSAPVLEVELASRSGIGWRGKHTLALHREAGSMFFLGEIYVDLALPPTEAVTAHCGGCSACIDVCPTQAIVAPYSVDARRCISYLTIEHAGAIPAELRPLMGNRIYGCDDCQLVCPWNKFAQRSALPAFDVRPPFGEATLLALWQWDEADFLRHTEGSAIRRIGHERWQRNLAVALGNLLRSQAVAAALKDAVRVALNSRLAEATALLREHIVWALQA